MGAIFRCVALLAALVAPGMAGAQDVTLTAREGGLAISGSLQGYDGEVYRILSPYGLLTLDAAAVLCDGPACPDLKAPKAVIRIVGLAGVGEALLPGLFQAFAKARGLTYQDSSAAGYGAALSDPLTAKTLAEISFSPAQPEQARGAVLAGRADLILSAQTEPGMGSKVVAQDAMVPVVAPDNALPDLSSRDLAQILAGEIDNWQQVGGPDMPLVVHGLAADSALQQALTARLGREVKADRIHPELAGLSAAVAADPWAIAVTLRAGVGAARPILLTDSCGFPLLPSTLAIKAGDYPLTLPIYLLAPHRRLPLMLREFLEFLNTPQAQSAVAATGYVDRQPERQAMTADGLRLINAIQGAGTETTLADLKRLVEVMDGADRLSLTFRFQDGSSQLDASSQDNLADLARLLEAGVFSGQDLLLAGFSDGSGVAAANLDLSLARAQGVLAGLASAAPGLAKDDLPQIMAFGEALPMACDETTAGRRLNRRVELWLRPPFTNSHRREN
jgi:phosphate transport system substrate-binding protein